MVETRCDLHKVVFIMLFTVVYNFISLTIGLFVNVKNLLKNQSYEFQKLIF